VLAQFGYSALTGSVTSRQALANRFTPLITIENGFLNVSPLLQGIFTDDRFAARDRMGRLIAFLARVLQDGGAAQVSAIATDEKMAFLMEPDGSGVVTGTGAGRFLRAAGTFNISNWTGKGGEGYNISAISGRLGSTQPGGSVY
jgi:cyanophycinase-like exopeptidase